MAQLHLAYPSVKKRYERDPNYDPLERLTDLELYKEYRMDKEEIILTTSLVKDDLPETRNCRGLPLKPHIVVMAALLYLATNAFQIRIARSLHLSQSTISRCITAFVKAFSSKVSLIVKFPSSAEENRDTMERFFAIASFPNVISVVDGTHVRIMAPHTDAHQYRCRKGYPSLNVQLACDARGIFTNIVCRWPGSSHDSHILRNSELYQNFESGQQAGIILGDSGYPCRPWLLTPYLNPQTELEKQFNSAQKKTRVTIECAIGRLKRRFAILHQEIRLALDIVPAAIASCVMLNNLIIQHGVRERVLSKYGREFLDDEDTEDTEDEESDENDRDQPGVTLYNGDSTSGIQFRNHVAMQMFRPN
jgi:nuclease HARBI1